MTNEEKAKQLYRKYKETNLARESAAFNAAMEMAKWKDKQFNETLKRANESITKAHEEGAKIERERILKKAVDWLTDNLTNYESWDDYGVNRENFLDDFKKTMKEEKELMFKDLCARLPYSV